MTDNKLTDKEIVKAYEFCLNNKDCIGCVADKHSNSDKFDCLLKPQDIIDVFNRLQAENERLNKEIETEIDKLNAEKNDVMYHKAQIKAEAYKEFAVIGAEAALQFGIDAIRQFIKGNTNLDPVYAFNPSGDEFNEMGRYALEMFESIAKELVGEENV